MAAFFYGILFLSMACSLILSSLSFMPMNDFKDNAKDGASQLFEAIKSAFPDSLANDARDNIKAVLSSALKEMDVVTREELEAQNRLLAQTRQQLDELSKAVKTLEENG